MAFAILRVQKLKTLGNIGGSLSHNYRNRKTSNADIERAHLNEHDLKTNQQTMAAIQNRLPEKRRKDAVLCIEHLITASPEWVGWGTEKESEFFEQSKKWLEEKYGKDNLISTTIHRDETTPHLVAYVVPLDELTGRLNAKKWLGGTRHTLTKMQTDFANRVKFLGLQRGLEGSKAEHTTIKSYYAEIQKPVPAVKKINFLEIEQKIEMPKVDLMTYLGTSKKEYAEVAQLMAYENIQKQIDAHTADMNKRFAEMQTTFEKKITAEKMRADRFQKAHERAVYEAQGLKKEYQAITEYKRLFPKKFKELEQSLRDDVKDYHIKIEKEKRQRQYESEMHLEKQRQAAIKKEKDFKKSISLKRDMRLDAQYDRFLQKLEECLSEPEKKAVMQLHDEKKANLAADPIQVMNEILSSKLEKSNNYFRACEGLFRIKSEYDFESVLEQTIKYFEQTAPSYQSGMGVVDGPVTRKVCAATSNWLDQLLGKYGSKYEDQAETLREHLLACDEKAEQSIFSYVLDDYITKERIEKNRAEIAAINASRDFSVRQQPGIGKDKGFDIEL